MFPFLYFITELRIIQVCDGRKGIFPFACSDENGAEQTIHEEIKNIFKKHIDKVREM